MHLCFHSNKRKISNVFIIILLNLVVNTVTWDDGFAQTDSVDVTFYYTPGSNPSIVYLAGEFNNWANNQSGRITDPRFAMTLDAATGRWTKTVRLRVGGPDPLPNPGGSILGTYQYKFNENGEAGGWTHDPLNPRQNPLDYNNSYLYIQDPTIHYLLPNSASGLLRTRFPEISAYLFPAVGNEVIASSITVIADETEYTDLKSGYDSETDRFAFILPDPLSSGTHSMKLFATSTSGETTVDSTTFTVQADFVQWLTQSNSNYPRETITLDCVVEDTTIATASLFHDGIESTVSVVDGLFSEGVTLQEGDNYFQASVLDSNGMTKTSDFLNITYVVDHAPRPTIQIHREGDEIVLTAIGNDPDDDLLTFHWQSDDELNPEPLGIDEEGKNSLIPLPATVGEYYIDLTTDDPDGNRGIARGTFSVVSPDSVDVGTVNSNPEWVRDAVVYEIFVPAFTPEGTLQAAKDRLGWIKSLGASIVWLMPIYQNGETINEMNAGYNITDFYTIHPQLGTMADFEAFVEEAHGLGLRVILDSTPNHVSEYHTWVENVRLFQEYSNYRPLIEKRLLGDDRGMGQSIRTMNGYTLFVYYDGWGLANLNYENIETVDYMMEMCKWWVLEKKIDGYRMDVYWGLQNRYGADAWWRPFREEIKRMRPDVFILGETDGTGPGSEINYADGGGASDAAYDWSFYGQIKSTLNNGSINALDSRVRNYSPNLRYNYYTGEHSHYLRFLENHDESRIASLYTTEQTKAAAALLFTIPGIPMIYAGQEVCETNRRGRINWDRAEGQELFNYYQRLIHIRSAFETFRSPYIKRINTNHSRIYAYLRPFTDQNGIVAVSFSGNTNSVTLSIQPSDLWLTTDSLQTGVTYYLNDVLNDTSYAVTKS